MLIQIVDGVVLALFNCAGNGLEPLFIWRPHTIYQLLDANRNVELLQHVRHRRVTDKDPTKLTFFPSSDDGMRMPTWFT